MILSGSDIEAFEQRFRTTFVNSLGGFKSLALIGTVNQEKQSNLAVFNSFFHVGAHPPLFGFVVRPDSVERHTLANIETTGFFTVNHVTEQICKNAHQTSARYPAHVSEFEATGLHEEYLIPFPAPFVAESTIRIGAEKKEILPVASNGTLIVIASMVCVSLPDEVVEADGFVNLEKAGTLACSGLDAYYKSQPIYRLSYAKPDRWPQEL